MDMTGVMLTYRRPLVVGRSKGINSPSLLRFVFSYIALTVNPRQKAKVAASLTKENSPP